MELLETLLVKFIKILTNKMCQLVKVRNTCIKELIELNLLNILPNISILLKLTIFNNLLNPIDQLLNIIFSNKMSK